MDPEAPQARQQAHLSGEPDPERQDHGTTIRRTGTSVDGQAGALAGTVLLDMKPPGQLSTVQEVHDKPCRGVCSPEGGPPGLLVRGVHVCDAVCRGYSDNGFMILIPPTNFPSPPKESA